MKLYHDYSPEIIDSLRGQCRMLGISQGKLFEIDHWVNYFQISKEKECGEGERCQRISWWLLGMAKTLGPLLTSIESSYVKASHWKCGSPHTPFFTVTRNYTYEAEKER